MGFGSGSSQRHLRAVDGPSLSGPVERAALSLPAGQRPSNRFGFACVPLLPPAGLLLRSGCGQSDVPDLRTVTGKVTLDGKPLAGATVILQPQSSGSPTASGATNNSGNDSLMFKPDVAGAMPGDDQLLLQTTQFSQEDIQEFRPRNSLQMH